jgi:hypothetical protein
VFLFENQSAEALVDKADGPQPKPVANTFNTFPKNNARSIVADISGFQPFSVGVRLILWRRFACHRLV